MQECINYVSTIDIIAYSELVQKTVVRVIDEYGVLDEFLEQRLTRVGEKAYKEFSKRENLSEKELYDELFDMIISEVEIYNTKDDWRRLVFQLCIDAYIPGESEEVLSCALEKYCDKKREGFEPDFNWRSYMIKVIKNIIKGIKKKKEKINIAEKQYKVVRDFENFYADKFFKPDKFPGITTETFRKILLETLVTLNREERTIINLYYFEKGFSYAKIAETFYGCKDHKKVIRKFENIINVLNKRITDIVEKEYR